MTRNHKLAVQNPEAINLFLVGLKFHFEPIPLRIIGPDLPALGIGRRASVVAVAHAKVQPAVKNLHIPHIPGVSHRFGRIHVTSRVAEVFNLAVHILGTTEMFGCADQGPG